MLKQIMHIKKRIISAQPVHSDSCNSENVGSMKVNVCMAS